MSTGRRASKAPLTVSGHQVGRRLDGSTHQRRLAIGVLLFLTILAGPRNEIPAEPITQAEVDAAE